MKNITVLFEPKQISYKTLIYKTIQNNQDCLIVTNNNYFNEIIIEETGESLQIQTSSKVNYTFKNMGNHNVLVKLKPKILYFEEAFKDTYISAFEDDDDKDGGLLEIPENLFF